MVIVNDERAKQAIQRIATEISKVDSAQQETAAQVAQIAPVVTEIGTATLISDNKYRLSL